MEEEFSNIQNLLKESVIDLNNCQIDKNLISCLSCQELINCKIRDLYVDLVYKSMNNKESGGFEF